MPSRNWQACVMNRQFNEFLLGNLIILSLALKDHPHLFCLSYSFRQCKCTYGSKTCRLCGRAVQQNIGLQDIWTERGRTRGKWTRGKYFSGTTWHSLYECSHIQLVLNLKIRLNEFRALWLTSEGGARSNYKYAIKKTLKISYLTTPPMGLFRATEAKWWNK